MSHVALNRTQLPALDARLRIGALDASAYWLGITTEPDTVVAAFDAGITTFFLTADMHWPRYDGLRRGLERLFDRGGDIRDRVVVGAVSYATQPEFCTTPFQDTVAAVRGLRHLDLAIAGGAYGYELPRRGPVYEQHRATTFQGVRAIGASFHDRAAAAAELCEGRFDVCLSRYNASHVGARVDLFPLIAERRVPLVNFTNTSGWVSPDRRADLGLGVDHWFPDVADHYRFVLGRPEIDGMLCSLAFPSHVAALADAIAAGPLDDDEQRHLELLAELGHGTSTLVA